MQPKVKRLDPATPSLTGASTDLLKNFLANPSQTLQGLQTQTPLQQGLGQEILALLTGQTAAGQTNSAAGRIQALLGGAPGQNVLEALQPLFARNLKDAQNTQSQFGLGPRFAANAQRENRLLSERALQDFDAFGQGVVENAVGRNLNFYGGLFNTASGTANAQAGAQGNLISQLLEAAFKGGGVTTQPQYVQEPSAFGQIGSLLGAVAPFALAPFTGGTSLAGAGAFRGGTDRGPLQVPVFGSSAGRSLANPVNF